MEKAFADAYAAIGEIHIVSSNGKISQPWDARDPDPAITLLRNFLEKVQAPVPQGPDTTEWVPLKTGGAWEHARWLTAADLERLLDGDLERTRVRTIDLQPKSQPEQVKMVLAALGRYVAVVDENQRFEWLIDRHQLLDRVAENL